MKHYTLRQNKSLFKKKTLKLKLLKLVLTHRIYAVYTFIQFTVRLFIQFCGEKTKTDHIFCEIL